MAKVFSIKNSGVIEEGAVVKPFELKGADITIPAILVGERGRGRELGVLPVQLLAESRKKLDEHGEVIIRHADVGQTKSGRPKLFERKTSTESDKAIVVVLVTFGFRGTCSVWGDVKPDGTYAPFPGEVIASGIIADGAAGRMAMGKQIIGVVPKGVVFATIRSGRLYGKEPVYFYAFDGKRIVALSEQEREVADVF